MATIGRLLALLTLCLLTGLLAGTGAAAADPPQRLDDPVTDRAGVLGAGATEVRAALNGLRTDEGVQLYVVYVPSFDGMTGQGWAEQSAARSQLGPRGALLAVAVEERAYGLWVGDGLPLDTENIDQIAADVVEPRLASADWAGAALAIAEELHGGGGGISAPWVVGGTLALIGGAYVWSRRRSRRAAAGTSGPEAPNAAPDAAPPDEFSAVPTTDLGYRASTALLELDDAVRTSEQELDLARAQFGDQAVAEFRAALDASRAEMVRAFGVRQQLDDETAEDEATRRAMLADIIRTCRAADERLDAQAAAFDELRDLERNAPAVVAGLGPALDAVEARLPAAEQQLATMRAGHAASALSAVADNVDQARQRIAAARGELAEAQAALGAGKQADAAVSARAVEDATAQAATLLDAINRLGEELDAAGARIADARAELEADLAEARALGPAGDLPAVAARAETALAAAERDLAGRDPLAALRRLTEAGAALDAGLTAAREARVRDERAAAALDRALLAARSSVAAAADFVSTRRGAVGPQARTRLAEAQRHLDTAADTAAGSTRDPAAALRAAQQADTLAQEALRLAQADVERWSPPETSAAGSAAIDIGSLVLGGILFGDGRGGGMFGGGGRGHHGGGWGGGFSPGSFGGSGTRGRRSTGGRF